MIAQFFSFVYHFLKKVQHMTISNAKWLLADIFVFGIVMRSRPVGTLTDNIENLRKQI